MLIVLMLLAPALMAQSAAPAGERVALVIGNGAYGEAALPNPRNDARSVSELLGRAGFAVDTRLDASRADLLQAISRFGQAIRDPKVRFAVFYYAGHGFQQDWRNYLVPVDAKVRSAADVPRQTVDIGELLRQMSDVRGRSYLVILDACRDDPFAGAYRPPARGLTQFDAPVGSLLAYATGPGRVALDGDSGGNGLYTKHLVRELGVPEASLEDAFKRVRLNVRVESRGRQVPWEMASLEENVFLFGSRKPLLSDRELEARFERELAAWSRAKEDNSIPGLVEFIRAFPSGNTSELAQARLNRLLEEELAKAQAAQAVAQAAPRPPAKDPRAERLAEQLAAQGAAQPPKPPPAAVAQIAPPKPPQPTAPQPPTPPVAVLVPPTAPAPPPVPAPTPPPTVVATAPTTAPPPIAPVSLPEPPVIVASLAPTPFFSGQDQHRRNYRVGDVFEFKVIDLFRGAARPSTTMQVTAVDVKADRVEFNRGEFISDMMGNTVANPRGLLSTPRQFYPAELVVGNRWRTEFKQARPSGWVYTFRYDVKVVGREKITVPAGTFDAYKIEANGFNVGLNARLKRTIWVAPGVDADIAHETFVQLRNGDIEQNDRQELAAYPKR